MSLTHALCCPQNEHYNSNKLDKFPKIQWLCVRSVPVDITKKNCENCVNRLMSLQTDTELPKNFKFTNEFKKAFELMSNSNQNIFITGNAGTGKSTLLEYFRQKTSKIC